MRRATRLGIIAAVAGLTSAYAGARDVYFAGTAGPYAVRVVVHLPGVVPGLARITVALAEPQEITRVSVQPIFWNVPPERAPAPDVARPAQGGEFHASLWLMVSGSYGVRVNVEGTRGQGTVIVPVTAVASERLDMHGPLGILLLALAGFLGAGMVTIVHAAARESTLSPGVAVDGRARRRGWIALFVGALAVTVLLFLGRRWWASIDAEYRSGLYRPPATRASVLADGIPVLQLEIQDSAWLARRRGRPLVQEDGQWTHIFLLGNQSAAFAHLHPSYLGDGKFEAVLPPLPAGRYRVFAEVTDSTGFHETLNTTVVLPELVATRREGGTPEGFWFVETDQGPCVVVSDQFPCQRLADQTSITWRTDLGYVLSPRTSRDDSLAIDWSAPEPADLLVLKSSGDIVHLRPHGTASRAALQRFAVLGNAVVDQPLGEVVFPYPLPTSQAERVWVGLRTGGRRIVAMFDLAAQGRGR